MLGSAVMNNLLPWLLRLLVPVCRLLLAAFQRRTESGGEETENSNGRESS